MPLPFKTLGVVLGVANAYRNARLEMHDASARRDRTGQNAALLLRSPATGEPAERGAAATASREGLRSTNPPKVEQMRLDAPVDGPKRCGGYEFTLWTWEEGQRNDKPWRDIQLEMKPAGTVGGGTQFIYWVTNAPLGQMFGLNDRAGRATRAVIRRESDTTFLIGVSSLPPKGLTELTPLPLG